MSDDHNQIRDAVIKLEAKMELMSESVRAMADAVSNLADLRYELKVISKDTHILENRVDKHDKDINNIQVNQRDIEKQSDKNAWVVKKIEVFWTALITGGAAFLWWLMKA